MTLGQQNRYNILSILDRKTLAFSTGRMSSEYIKVNYMNNNFECHLISLFDSKFVIECSEKQKQFNNKYEDSYHYQYNEKLSAHPEDFKKAIKSAFNECRKYLNNPDYYNETCFINHIDRVMEETTKSQKSVYFLSLINAMSELYEEIPELNPGYFHSYFLSIIHDFKKKDKDLLINHYLNNINLNFSDYPLNFTKRTSREIIDRYYESDFSLIVIPKSIHNYFKLLSESESEKQKIYKKLLPPNINKSQISYFLKYTNEAGLYSAKKLNFTKIEPSILLEILPQDDIFTIRNNHHTKCALNDSLNEFISTNFHKEDIFSLYVDRMIVNPQQSIQNNKYDIALFNDENPYLHFNDLKIIDKIAIAVKEDLYRSNKLFKRLGFYNNNDQPEAIISEYLHKQKIIAEKKHLDDSFANNHFNFSVKKRL